MRADLPAMCEIFKAGQRDHHAMYPEIFCKPDDEEKILVYLGGFLKPRNPLRTQKRFAEGWYEEGVLLGYLLYQIHQTSDVFFGNNRWSAYVDDIAVSEAARGNGIGSKLLNSLVQKVEERGGGMVSGQVWKQNESSEALFGKAGFDAVATQFYRVL